MKIIFTPDINQGIQSFYQSYGTNTEWASVIYEINTKDFGCDFSSIQIPSSGGAGLIGKGFILDCLVRLLSVEP